MEIVLPYTRRNDVDRFESKIIKCPLKSSVFPACNKFIHYIYLLEEYKQDCEKANHLSFINKKYIQKNNNYLLFIVYCLVIN